MPTRTLSPSEIPSELAQWVALAALLAMLVAAWSCRREAPLEPYVRSIALGAVEASCTEAWLKVSLTDSNEPRTIALTRDGQRVSDFRLLTSDTLVVDEGLLPNRTYTYKAYRMADTRMIDSSTQVALTTMDTTSHNFTWQIDTLGDGGGSVLYDVAIINDTLAYAVGVFDLVYHFNGNDWQRIQISVPGHTVSPHGTYWAVWADGNEVFICESVENGIIYHGR